MLNLRTAVVAAVIVLFVGIGAYLVFSRSSSSGQARTLEVKVTGSKMEPETLTARQGDTLTIDLTADKEEEIHLHGYDKHFEAKPGQKVTETFKADKSGSFEIEIESSSTHLGELQVSP
jgi:FtsP/CotA-like multicopper oxidase with cupredoxin domain